MKNAKHMNGVEEINVHEDRGDYSILHLLI